jgi:allene oxide cyclase
MSKSKQTPFFLLGAIFALLSATATAAGRLAVIEHAITDTTVPVGGQGDKLGNLLVFSNPVYDSANRARVGRDQGYCVRVAVGRSWECFWTLILSGGEITSEGPYYDHGDSVMVITGGSGRYAGAKGSLKLHARDAKGSSYDFIYDLD